MRAASSRGVASMRAVLPHADFRSNSAPAATGRERPESSPIVLALDMRHFACRSAGVIGRYLLRGLIVFLIIGGVTHPSKVTISRFDVTITSAFVAFMAFTITSIASKVTIIGSEVTLMASEVTRLASKVTFMASEITSMASNVTFVRIYVTSDAIFVTFDGIFVTLGGFL